MTLPTHTADQQHRRRYGVFRQKANAPAAGGPPIQLPDEAPEIARANVPDHVLSHRTSADDEYGLIFGLAEYDPETGEWLPPADWPEGVPVLTHDEIRAHMAAHRELWDGPDDTL